MNKLITLVFFFLSLLVLNCTKDKTYESEDTVFVSDNSQLKGLILTDLANNIILPNNQLLKVKASDLSQSSIKFIDNSNLTNLIKLQDSWKNSQNQWEQNCLYNFGPVRDKYLFDMIDTWPSNLIFINNLLSGSDSINSNYLDTKGATIKGLPAIENVIFSLDFGNQSILDSFIISDTKFRRKQYLLSLAENFLHKAIQIDSIWDKDRGSYYYDFISNTQNEINGSFNVYLNNIIELLGYIVITKLEKPMGKPSGVVKPNLSESYNSENSISNIYQNLIVIEKGLTGSVQNMNFKGINDLLDKLNAQKGSMLLGSAIAKKIDSVRISIDQVASNSIAKAAVNEPSQLENLLNHFKGLYDLIRLDVTNSTGVIVTFSGNDGD